MDCLAPHHPLSGHAVDWRKPYSNSQYSWPLSSLSYQSSASVSANLNLTNSFGPSRTALRNPRDTDLTSPLIVFTTDFGLSDAYAGVMKGVALTINPDLRFIDLSHQILPQNIAQGSFLLGINHRFFPKNAIHVTVVDPGVGTDRRPILLTTPCGSFVAPDNGLLSGVNRSL